MSDRTTARRANAGIDKAACRRIMHKLSIAEISAVDRPAQEGATAVIMKRNDEKNPAPTTIEKRMVLTTPVDGHQHMLEDSDTCQAGTTSWDQNHAPNYHGHSHPWVKNSDGKIIIGEAMGHTHEVLEVSKAADPKEQDMNEKEAQELKDRLAKAEADAALNKALAALSDADKAHYNGLDDAGKTAFLTKSADERRAEVDAAAVAKKAGEAVVYKSRDGFEFTSKHDPLLVTLAKKNDKLEADIEKARAEAEQSALEKRAGDELGHLPGDVKVRAALLKAVEGIKEEELRKGALAAIKSKAPEVKAATKTVGTSTAKAAAETTEEVEVGSPEAHAIIKRQAEDEIEALAKAYEAEHKVPYLKAYQAVLETERGAELYDATVNPEAYEAAE